MPRTKWQDVRVERVGTPEAEARVAAHRRAMELEAETRRLLDARAKADG